MSDVTLKAIETLLDDKLEKLVTKDEFHDRIDGLQTAVDGLVTDVRTIKQELPVLRAGQERIKTVLVEKEIATARELSIQQ